MTFTERDAIQFEMEELKEQARRDFEIYLTSRNMRNERYTQLMERLREIDMRETPKQPVEQKEEFFRKRAESTPVRDLPTPRFQGTLQDLRVDKVRPNQEIIMKKEEAIKNDEPITKGKSGRKYHKRTSGYVKLEQVDPVVEKYLKFRGTEERLKDIQAFAEKELENKWSNFTELMKKVMEVNPRIKRSERKGFYYYDSM